MAAPTINKVRETYRKHFKALGDSASAWNATLDELGGVYDGNAPDDVVSDRRHKMVEHLHKVQREVDLEEGDPYELAMHAAIEALKKDRVETAARDEYRKALDEIKAKIREDYPEKRKGPKEWSPRKKGDVYEEELEELLQKELESGDLNLSLFITFDDYGGLKGWTIEHPDYRHGHAGPVAQVFVSDRTDYDEIRSAIAEAFEGIDWDEVSEELESDEESDPNEFGGRD